MTTDPTKLPTRSQIVLEQLTALGVTTEITVLPDAAHTADAAAAGLGCEVGAIANSLVFVADGVPMLVMTSGSHRVDPGVLAGRLGAGDVALAPAKVVRSATGQAIGGVAPVGHPTPLPALIDEALGQYPTIWTAAGTPNTVMPLTLDQLVAVTGGDLAKVAVD